MQWKEFLLALGKEGTEGTDVEALKDAYTGNPQKINMKI